MAVKKKFNALGRGLDALISTEDVKTQGGTTINEIKISQIEANPNQPRREFAPEALQELSDSIKELGIISPITLREIAPDRYQIIAGERRWRASQMAGLKTIPAYIRTTNDEEVMEMALVENIQREDLNAIEIALAYNHLLENEGMTQEKVAERVGKSRTAVTNYLRLLRLPAQIQMALQKKEIDMGHARALLSLENTSQQLEAFTEIKNNNYSVRDVEELVKDAKNEIINNNKPKDKNKNKQQKEEFKVLSKSLSDFFSAQVKIKVSEKNKGQITIPFNNEEELEHIIELFDKLKK